MQRFVLACLVTLAVLGLGAPKAQAQSTEERFQDLFVTAGYATAFGAAVGVALLAWQDDPSANLKMVAVGASLGFLGGSVVGSYIIFSPMLTDTGAGAGSTLTADAIPREGIVVRPTYDTRTKTLTGVETGMTLATF